MDGRPVHARHVSLTARRVGTSAERAPHAPFHAAVGWGYAVAGGFLTACGRFSRAPLFSRATSPILASPALSRARGARGSPRLPMDAPLASRTKPARPAGAPSARRAACIGAGALLW